MIGAVADHSDKLHNMRGGKQTIQHTSSAGIRHEKTALLAPPRRTPTRSLLGVQTISGSVFIRVCVCVCVCVCVHIFCRERVLLDNK